MKYKILKGTDSFKQLTLLQQKINAANDKSKELVNELGAKEFCYSSNWYVLAGGLAGIRFPEKPIGWKRVFKDHYRDMYFPQRNLVANKELLEKIKNLPLVETDELNKIVGFEEQSYPKNGKSIHVIAPVISFRDEHILMSINENLIYKPLPDMIEITTSEYKALMAPEPEKVPV